MSDGVIWQVPMTARHVLVVHDVLEAVLSRGRVPMPELVPADRSQLLDLYLLLGQYRRGAEFPGVGRDADS